MAPATASDQKPQDKQPLQDANGRHDTPHLLPAPSLRPPHTQPQPQASHLTLHSHAATPHSNEPVSITVGSIANAYFASAPGAEGTSAWGSSLFGPGQEASQAAALGGQPSFPRLTSPAAVSPSMTHGESFPSRSPAIPFASDYMNGIQWEADAAPPQLYPSPQQQQPHLQSARLSNGLGTLAHGSSPNHALKGRPVAQEYTVGTSDKPAHSSGGSNASSKANSRQGRGRQDHQQTAGAAVSGRPGAAANSPALAVQDREAGRSGRVRPAARSPPRYHNQARYALNPCCSVKIALAPTAPAVSDLLACPGCQVHAEPLAIHLTALPFPALQIWYLSNAAACHSVYIPIQFFYLLNTFT